MKRMKGREVGNQEYEKFKDGLDRYVKIQGIESKLVNIPTIVTGLNEDGTIKQEQIEPYAYEIVEQDKGFTD
ncbi:hypothetical protein [Clostridium sp. CF012]|uniref:hypothetical protein n=1 Tax=Clostridium sp. CF012 TaxID=2843319 RepID=UPI001C0E15CD|nr:hypothetical protein [Clostridium sp. CF012]MBU3144526.1 hypothetical protein [Clostridium sp. CF012]